MERGECTAKDLYEQHPFMTSEPTQQISNEVHILFDPFIGPYAAEYLSEEFDREVRERFENIWFGVAEAYVTRNEPIYLNSIAEKCERNPLPQEEADAAIAGDFRIDQALVNNYNHTPYNVFLTVLGARWGRNLNELESNNYMQFESNYLKALMVAHPNELHEAMLIYQKYKASFDGYEQSEEILSELAEKFILGGAE